MASNYVEIPGSYRSAPTEAAAIAGAHQINSAKPIEISVYLKDREPDPLLQQEQMTAGDRPTSDELKSKRMWRYAADFAKLARFANKAGLSIVKQDPSRRLVKLSGPADKLEAAFRTKLHYYNDGKNPFRARSGFLSAPADVVDSIEAVLGLDTRPIAEPKLTHLVDPHTIAGHLPSDIAKLYAFPATNGQGAGQCIALIELGGGFRSSDNQKAFEAMKLVTPKVTSIPVSGGLNQPGMDPTADEEVALDIQVAGGAAPGAAIAVYFAPNTDQGCVDAITRAVHDDQNGPSIISISWALTEMKWTGQVLKAMTSALQDAARSGVTVLAAAGDHLATDGLQDGRAHTVFPASSEYVIACGGTVIDVVSGVIQSEMVWNDAGSGRGTGGGISDQIDRPAYQANANLPGSFNDHVPGSVNNHNVRRGVPDVAGNADQRSGYRIVVDGVGLPKGGTSAVAPLWAGLFALINEACGTRVGFVHNRLYSNPTVFRQITQGDNKVGQIGYSAGAGWNACTGLGVPDGEKILAMFKQAIGSSPAIA